MTKNGLIIASLAVLLLAAAPAALLAADGMTWKKHSHDSLLGTDHVGCGGCDPYNGDTACTTYLPILCIKQDGSPDPGVSPSGFYHGWAKGHIALTPPVQGSTLTSVSVANGLCASYHGSGWRMAEFHDGGGGWNWHAYGNIRDDTRFWVHINDQANGNCW